ncbi:L-aspartate oxidase [Candidatus Margulisiibacteriota bacterium]
MKKLETNVLIVGSGAAGLSCALQTAGTIPTMVVTKETVLYAGNTSYAQGGIAVPLGDDDSVKDHIADTLAAGCGLCNKNNVEILVSEGKKIIQEFIQKGFQIDMKDNKPLFNLESAHSHSRVIHFGDSTGISLLHFLFNEVKKLKHFNLLEHFHVHSLLVEDNHCVGVLGFDVQNDEPLLLEADVVVLATGGGSSLFRYSTNPAGSIGDGVGLAYAVGAPVADLEFIQFHPTMLYQPGVVTQSVLISEVVRGAGALVRNVYRESFLKKYHERAEHAPRDIVSRAIYSEMKSTDTNHVYLDFSTIPSQDLRGMFPTIYRGCREAGFKIDEEMIPVIPAAHYFMGGVVSNEFGQTAISHLYVCGETAHTGVHGANRLASNSLLESIVFGRRAGLKIVDQLPQLQKEKISYQKDVSLPSSFDRSLSDLPTIQEILWASFGIVRKTSLMKKGLKSLQNLIAAFTKKNGFAPSHHYTALLIAQAALHRKESRGAHFVEKMDTDTKMDYRHWVWERGKKKPEIMSCFK